MADQSAATRNISSAEFREMYERLRRSRPWGASDRRGALNYIRPEHIVEAAGQVRTGRNVSLAALIEHERSPDNPDPCTHEVVEPADDSAIGPGLSFALDELSLHIHGDADSHLDALCHVIFDRTLYGDVPASEVTSAGAGGLAVDVAGQGIVGRGVLLDIPPVRGAEWLDPGDHVTVADLAAAEAAEHVRVGPGDLLFVRVGHRLRREALGAWDAAKARAGLHPALLELLADRQVAVLGSDSNNDTAPSIVDGVGFPVHVLAIRALGLQLLDYLQFEDLREACQDTGRWTFLCVIAPLRLPNATGSPINPIAVL